MRRSLGLHGQLRDCSARLCYFATTNDASPVKKHSELTRNDWSDRLREFDAELAVLFSQVRRLQLTTIADHAIH